MLCTRIETSFASLTSMTSTLVCTKWIYEFTSAHNDYAIYMHHTQFVHVLHTDFTTNLVIILALCSYIAYRIHIFRKCWDYIHWHFEFCFYMGACWHKNDSFTISISLQPKEFTSKCNQHSFNLRNAYNC